MYFHTGVDETVLFHFWTITTVGGKIIANSPSEIAEPQSEDFQRLVKLFVEGDFNYRFYAILLGFFSFSSQTFITM